MNCKSFVFFILAFMLVGCGGHKHKHKHFIIKTDPTELVVGSQVSGHIDRPGDTDWYVVELSAGQEYKFCTTNLSADMDSVLRLIDTDGLAVLDENDNVGDTLASCITFCVPTSGRYYLVVTHKDPSARTGMYDLLATALGECSHLDDAGSDDDDDDDTGSDDEDDTGSDDEDEDCDYDLDDDDDESCDSDDRHQCKHHCKGHFRHRGKGHYFKHFKHRGKKKKCKRESDD